MVVKSVVSLELMVGSRENEGLFIGILLFFNGSMNWAICLLKVLQTADFLTTHRL